MHLACFLRAPNRFSFLAVALALSIFNPTLGQQPPQAETPPTATQQADLAEAGRLSKVMMQMTSEGKLKEATVAAEGFLQVGERLFGPDHPSVAGSLDTLAQLHIRQGNEAAAIPLYRRSLKIIESNLGPDHADTAKSQNNLAMLLLNRGDFAAALPLFQRALTTCEKVFGPEHPNTASTLNNLAGLYDNQGNSIAAEPLYLRSLKIREKSFGPEHPATAEGLNNLAMLYSSQGEFGKAEPLFKRALSIVAKTPGPDHPDFARGLNNLANLYQDQGNYSAAEPLYLQAIKVLEKGLGPEHPRTATSLNNLAQLYIALGNYRQAEPLLLKSLSIRERVLGPTHPDTAGSLNNLASLFEKQNKHNEAENLYRRALQIWEKTVGADHPSTARSLNNLGAVAFRKGDYDTAESMFERALKAREKIFGLQHREVAESLGNLGAVYEKQGKDEAAERSYRKGLEIHQRVFGPNHPSTTDTSLNNLASFLERIGRTMEGANAYESARRGIRFHTSRVLPFLTEKEQSQFLATNYVDSLSGALSLALRHTDDPKIARLSSGWLINGKAVAQEALAQGNLLNRDKNDPKRGELTKNLLQIRKRLATLSMSTVDPLKAPQREATIAKLTEEERGLLRELNSSVNDAREMESVWIEVEQVEKSLPIGTVFIDIARFKPYDFMAQKGESPFKPARYAAWIIQSSGPSATVVDLGLADDIDSSIDVVRKGIQKGSGGTGTVARDGEETATNSLMKDLTSLADQIWKPLEKHLKGVEQVVLSPDGALWIAPWSSLPVGPKGESYLIENYGLRFVTSGRELIVQVDQVQTGQPIIMANPSFDQNAGEKQTSIQAIFKSLPESDDTTTRSFSAKNLLPKVVALPNTGVEAMAIQPNIEKYTSQKAVLYQERYALEHVAKMLIRPKIATFATHGFFLPSQKVDSSGSSNQLGPVNSTIPIENPLLRCGLLLAGCNNREAAVGDDDGILTGLEIVGIDFRGTEIVVLSACETGLGEIKNGEGVAGLRQAFQLAGAQSVVATLWQVPDRDSALLMNHFFENLADGKSRSEAMRAAQLERIEKRRERFGAAHPFFWAAFTVTGH